MGGGQHQVSLKRSPRGPPKTSEKYTLLMKTKSRKGTSQRVSEVLLETLSEERFLLSETLGLATFKISHRHIF